MTSSRISWNIIVEGTDCRDGDYFDKNIAEYMLGFYQAGWPSYEFKLVRGSIAGGKKIINIPIEDRAAAEEYEKNNKIKND